MPIYTSNQNVKSGLPLGGIGAGKLEIMPCGLLDNFTFLNNIHKPLVSEDDRNPSGIAGFHFGIFVSDKRKKIAKLLQTQALSDYPVIKAIKFNGAFPFASLDYEDKDLPVEVSLEAFSSFIRKDEKDSALPVAYFKFKITNPFSRPVDIAIMGIGRNIVGEWPVGRFNQVIDTQNSLNLYFYNKKTQSCDPSSGEIALSILKNSISRNSVKDFQCSYLGEWNMQAKPFVFNKQNLSLGEAWDSFSKDGKLSDINSEKVAQAEGTQLGGALCANFKLKAKSSVTITFAISWFFPGFGEGHMYESRFRNVSEVINYVSEKYALLYQNTKAWVKELNTLKIDSWLKDAFLNNLYPIVSSSMWTKRDRFGIFESPQNCPLLGTLDVRFYGSLPLALFFPQLELKEMIQFAEAQRPQGYVPHDLGFKRSDLPSNSTNGLFWKDLNSKFILLVYRDFLITKDEAFLKKMYPFIKKAFYWLCSTDKNKDYLPDNEGADQTFDLWNFYGASAYTSGIFLASLLALEKIASIMSDKDMCLEAATWFKQAKISFEKKLWRNSYFIEYNDTRDGLSEKQLLHYTKLEKVGVSCMAAQLAGQWIAHLLGLGYIVSQEKVRKSLQTIFKLNASVSAFGIVNSVLPSGEKDKTNLQSENIWVGINYCLSSLAIYEDCEKEALNFAKKAWDNMAENNLNPWNQPDMCSASDGSYVFGDHYMRNMVIWSIMFALAKKDKSIKAFLEA